MITDALDRAVDAMVEHAEHRGPRKQTDIGHGGEFGRRRLCPFGPGPAGQRRWIGVEPAAQQEILVGEHHPRARAPGGQRRGKPRGTTADHEQVAMEEPLVVEVRVWLSRKAAEARRAPDRRLIELLPERPRPHEGLVVEAGRQKRGEPVVHRQRVEAQGGPAVLAACFQAVEQLGGGRARIRFLPRARAQLDQGIRFFRSRGEHAARAMILEASPDQPHAVRQQRRSEGIARMSLIGASVEREAEGPIAVYPPARDAIPLAHRCRTRRSATSRASSTAVISCVETLRVTTSQLRSPCS